MGRDLLPFDIANYWLPLREALGLDGRRGGHDGFPNIQGQAGALLMVYGFTRPGARRAVYVTTGAAILLLTDSRTSYSAAAAGLILLALLPGWRPTGRAWPVAKVVALVLGVAMAVRVALKVAADPNLTGRIAVWPEFLSLSSQNPMLGAGAPAIDEAVAAGDLPGWADQGHNILIDTFVRFGIATARWPWGFSAWRCSSVSGGRGSATGWRWRWPWRSWCRAWETSDWCGPIRPRACRC